MKIIVERDKFADAAASAMRAAGGSLHIPILHNLLITPNGKSVHIAGSQLDMQLETSCAADITGSSASGLTVPGAALVELVNRMPKGAQVAIEWDDKPNAHAIFASGRARYKLQTLPAHDFPALMSPQEPITFALPGTQLIAALNPIRFAICNDRARNYMCGIHIHTSDEQHPVFAPDKGRQLRLVACDGHNMGIAILPVPPGADAAPAITLPDTTIAEICRLATDARDDMVEFKVSPTLVSVMGGGKTFTTKLIDGEFPPYHKPIPREFVSWGVVDCDEWLGALSRLLAIDNGKRMRASINEGVMRMHLLNQVGEADEEITIDDWQGPEISIPMNVGWLASIVESAKSDACIVQFVNAKSPVVIQPWRAGVADTTHTFVTMPME